MTTKITYIANDGTEFEEYEECLQHEKETLAKENFMGQVTVFNSVGEGTVIKEGLSLTEIEHKFCICEYIRFESTKAADSFFRFMKEQGLTWKLNKTLWINNFMPKRIYKFDNIKDYLWYDYTRMIENQVKFEKKMREWNE